MSYGNAPAFEIADTGTGKYEIRNNTTRPSHPVGGTSWAMRSDAEFICSHLNNAFQSGALAGQALAGLDDGEKRLVRSSALAAAAEVCASHSGGTEPEDVLKTAKLFESYILGS